MRREASAAVGLLVTGAALLVLASGLEPEPRGTAALGLVSGAGAAASVAARGWLRRGVGVLLVVTGVLAVAAGLQVGAWAPVAGGVCTAAGGLWVAWRGPRWSQLSERYARSATDPQTPHALWDALDRGEDPT